ncbi:MAG TPA: PH domain-containing protein [Planctomycetota bacterium]|nr:PH domain-containing protein [Planctomycetota bacterium]
MSDTPDNPPAKVSDGPLPLPKPEAAAPKNEQVIFHGSVSMWLGAKSIATAALFIIVALAALIYGSVNQGTSLGTIALIGGVALFVASNLMLGYVILSIRSLKYKITNRLIEREQGIIFRRVDALDLARVKDVQLSHSLIDRMIGVGTIEIYSSDSSDPQLKLEAIPQPRPVYEALRDAVIEISQRRGIVSMSQ